MIYKIFLILVCLFSSQLFSQKVKQITININFYKQEQPRYFEEEFIIFELAKEKEINKKNISDKLIYVFSGWKKHEYEYYKIDPMPSKNELLSVVKKIEKYLKLGYSIEFKGFSDKEDFQCEELQDDYYHSLLGFCRAMAIKKHLAYASFLFNKVKVCGFWDKKGYDESGTFRQMKIVLNKLGFSSCESEFNWSDCLNFSEIISLNKKYKK